MIFILYPVGFLANGLPPQCGRQVHPPLVKHFKEVEKERARRIASQRALRSLEEEQEQRAAALARVRSAAVLFLPALPSLSCFLLSHMCRCLQSRLTCALPVAGQEKAKREAEEEAAKEERRRRRREFAVLRMKVKAQARFVEATLHQVRALFPLGLLVRSLGSSWRTAQHFPSLRLGRNGRSPSRPTRKKY